MSGRDLPAAVVRRLAWRIAEAHVNRKERCVEPDDRAAWCADYAEDHWHEFVPHARSCGAEVLAIIEERAGPVKYMLPDGRFVTIAELLEDRDASE